MTNNNLIEVAIVSIGYKEYYDLDETYSRSVLENLITNWEQVTQEQYDLLLKHQSKLGGLLLTRTPVQQVLTKTIPQIIKDAEETERKQKEREKKYKQEEKERELSKKKKALERAKKKAEVLQKELGI